MSDYGGGRRGGGHSVHSISDNQDMIGADGAFGFNVLGVGNYEKCTACFTGQLISRDQLLICNQCGAQQENIRANAILEYEDNFRAKAARMKIDDVKEKVNPNLSPKKGFISKLDVDYEFGPTYPTDTGFQVIGNDTEGKNIYEGLLSRNENYKDYIKAYEDMLMSISAKFSQIYLLNESDREEFINQVKDIYQQYMKKWDAYQDSIPLSSFTQQRRGQLRLNNHLRYSGFKREFFQIQEKQKADPNEGKTQNEDQQQINHLQEIEYTIDNEETKNVDATESLSIQEAEQINLISQNLKSNKRRKQINDYNYGQLNQEYKETIKTHRKRDIKKSSKISSGSTSADGQAFFSKANFKKQIQDLISKDDANIVLDFISLDSHHISLLDRAKLFVKLKYGEQNLKGKIRSVKFKQTVNVMLNDSILPTKSSLIKICKENLNIDYRQYKFTGLNSIKNRIIMAIFIYHKVVCLSKKQRFIENFLIFEKQKEDILRFGDQQILDQENNHQEIEVSRFIIVEDNQIDLEVCFSRDQLQQFCYNQYSQEILKIDLQESSLEQVLEFLFEILLSSESSTALEEFQNYKIEPVTKIVNFRPPSHSLELNLILAFIYMASRKYNILERDVLFAAQQNYIGYLTQYREHSLLLKSEYLLRPINVAFKNKWLRDTVHDLVSLDQLPLSETTFQSLTSKFCDDLLICNEVQQLSLNLHKKLKRSLKISHLFLQFEVSAFLIISFKLLYGLADRNINKSNFSYYSKLLIEDEQFQDFHEIILRQRHLPNFQEQYDAMVSRSKSTLLQTVKNNHTLKYDPSHLWKVEDVRNMTDLDSEIIFAQENIYNLNEDEKDSVLKKVKNEITEEDNDRLFKQRSQNISDKFADYFAQYQMEKQSFDSADKTQSNKHILNFNSNASDQNNFNQYGFVESFEVQDFDNEELVNQKPFSQVIVEQEIEMQRSHRHESEELEIILDQMIPSRIYSVYNKKLTNLEGEYYHFEFMMVVKVFQDYLNEPTCQDILKYNKIVEGFLLMQI